MKPFRYISDPGHGWLEVPISLLQELGIAGRISVYSYVHGELAYLEEDLDMGIFLEAMKQAGREVECLKLYQASTPIRQYPSFRADQYAQAANG